MTKLPPLPSGSVDVAALEKALNAKNADPAKAVAAALVLKTEPNEVSDARKARLEAREDATGDGLTAPAATTSKPASAAPRSESDGA